MFRAHLDEKREPLNCWQAMAGLRGRGPSRPALRLDGGRCARRFRLPTSAGSRLAETALQKRTADHAN